MSSDTIVKVIVRKRRSLMKMMDSRIFTDFYENMLIGDMTFLGLVIFLSVF